MSRKSRTSFEIRIKYVQRNNADITKHILKIIY